VLEKRMGRDSSVRPLFNLCGQGVGGVSFMPGNIKANQGYAWKYQG
jgi:hypothetical protein